MNNRQPRVLDHRAYGAGERGHAHLLGHVYRYAFASCFVAGKRVLDMTCGEGYGAAALQKAGAAHVIGVDVSEFACLHAGKRYGLDQAGRDSAAGQLRFSLFRLRPSSTCLMPAAILTSAFAFWRWEAG
jgi:hypothetical protein